MDNAAVLRQKVSHADSTDPDVSKYVYYMENDTSRSYDDLKVDPILLTKEGDKDDFNIKLNSENDELQAKLNENDECEDMFEEIDSDEAGINSLLLDDNHNADNSDNHIVNNEDYNHTSPVKSKSAALHISTPKSELNHAPIATSTEPSMSLKDFQYEQKSEESETDYNSDEHDQLKNCIKNDEASTPETIRRNSYTDVENARLSPLRSKSSDILTKSDKRKHVDSDDGASYQKSKVRKKERIRYADLNDTFEESVDESEFVPTGTESSDDDVSDTTDVDKFKKTKSKLPPLKKKVNLNKNGHQESSEHESQFIPLHHTSAPELPLLESDSISSEESVPPKAKMLEKQTIAISQKTKSKLPIPEKNHNGDLNEDKCQALPTNAPGSKMGIQKVAMSSEGGKYYSKENFCIFCKSLHKRIDKHLLAHHANEKKVLEASLLPPKNKVRRQMLAELRLAGNDLYNTNKIYNPEGIIICARRQRISQKEHKGFQKVIKKSHAQTPENEKNDEEDNSSHSLTETHEGSEVAKVPETDCNKKKNTEIEGDDGVVLLRLKCPHCIAYYSYTNLRNHLRLKHPGEKVEGTRQMLALSKQSMGLWHPEASQEVKDHLLSKLKFDAAGIIARYDLLIILYGNKFIQKYSEPSQLAYVRGHMRLLAKLLKSIQTINPRIKELKTVFRPLYWPTLLEAINMVSNLDSGKNRFLIIYNAETIPLLLRKCIKILKNYYTIKEKDDLLEFVVKFERVFDDEIEYQVLYKAVLSRKEANRHKDDAKLPRSEEILTFENYLKLKRSVSMKEFETGNVNYDGWVNLVETTACLIIAYNRRRVGEISKTLVNDYLHARKADPDSEFFSLLPADEQKQRLKYTRIDIQGKRIDGKGSLYISKENEDALELIYKYRVPLGVEKDNPYLFGLKRKHPTEKHQHINLCLIMTRLSRECSVNFKEIDDETMRGTLLRKQLATLNAATSNVSSAIASKHLGHSVNVHHTHYRLTVDGDDVAATRMLDAINKGAVTERNNNNESNDDNSSIDVTQQNKDISANSSDGEIFSALNSSGEPNQLTTLFGIRTVSSKKNTWKPDEIAGFNEAFKNCLETNRYATSQEMRDAQKKYPILSGRSEKVIRARFSNIFNRGLKKGVH